jgi:hypothetical protein
VITEIGGTPLEHSSYSPDLAPCNFWAFLTMKTELRSQNRLFHHPPEACGKRSAARFREVGGELYGFHCSPREVLRKVDRHRIPTNFRLGVNKVSPRNFQTAVLTIRRVRTRQPPLPGYLYVDWSCVVRTSFESWSGFTAGNQNLTLKMEAAWPSETLVSYHIIKPCHIPEDREYNLYPKVISFESDAPK